MTKIHFYVDIWSRSSQRPSHSPLPCRDIGHILLWALHFSRESEHFVPDTDIIYFCYLLLLHTSLQDPSTGPLMLIRCGLNSVLVVNSVKIPNISRLSNWPLCHCEGIEDVLLTMTIINCNKFWFSTQWAFFTEQFELETNIPTPGWWTDQDPRYCFIPGVFELWWTLRQCQLSDFLSFYASNRDPRTLDIVTESVTRSLGCHAVCDRVSILTLQ